MRRSFSFLIDVGILIGPFSNGPAIAPTLFDVGSILPAVKSTSLTTIPGDAKFSGIFILRLIQNYLKVFIN